MGPYAHANATWADVVIAYEDTVLKIAAFAALIVLMSIAFRALGPSEP